ncbi:MAG: zinc ribbon domain-containing protein [Jatrophihabitans sp.]|uniref:zinc ribbon domain-containing protein n=1 Tax=Jatrophihabitans sp. TaxID=1932789 RepID=UPI003F7D5580
MNADHATQLRLLDLAGADQALAQLTHRRRSLPELAALTEKAKRAAALRDEIVDAETAVGDLDAEQQRFEREIDSVRTRAQRDEQRMQSGAVPAKELEGLQHELTSLARRQSSLEDDLLEVMERRESADEVLERLTAALAVVDAERSDLESRRDAAFAEIDAAAAERAAERERVVASLPADLVALYEKARAKGGAGAALLQARRCQSCHIELPGSELAAVRAAAPDQVVRCDNCGAILVRTEESGL